MHDSVLAFVHRVTRKHGLKSLPTLELGSCNVNGSARRFFDGPYTGIDTEEGPGVDFVMSSHDLVFKLDPEVYESVRVVVCTEMLEHDPNPWKTMEQVSRVLPRDGWLILSTRGNGFPLHNPPDRFRFLEEGIRSLVDVADCEVIELQADPQVSGWLVLAQRK